MLQPFKLTKPLFFIATILAGTGVYAQQLKGRVTDKETRLPVNGALVSIGNAKVITNGFGNFSITAKSINDTLKVGQLGYKPYKMAITDMFTDIHIELKPEKIVLNEVVIRSNREVAFKRDSLNKRSDYAKQFNYKGPKIMDAFASKPFKNPGELLTVDIMTLIRAFTKKSTNAYKFNKILLRDEQADYVDHRFSRGLIGPVTGLKGDTLSIFMSSYRPTYKFARKATDYEMANYIKQSYQKFVRQATASTDPFILSRKDTATFRLN